MPSIVVHHDVDDTEHWLASPVREEFFGPLGTTNVRTFTNPRNPTQVALTMDVPDMDARVAAMQSPQAADAMKSDGVHADEDRRVTGDERSARLRFCGSAATSSA